MFWYGHRPKMHDMVSDRSSRAEISTDLRKIAMRVFFDSKYMSQNTNVGQKHATMLLSVKQIFEKLHGPYQNWKKQFIRYNPIKFN